jgi:6,7-dimethyl-8-ribityllumazine synthase
VSSRDIDSTSENVLHDWANEERDAPGPEAVEDDETPAWGAASAPAEPEEQVATAVEAEPEEEEELEQADLDEDVSEAEEGELDETPMHVELSQEHAAGDLHIPDGYAVLEGVAEGGRRAVGVVVSRFNGKVTTQLLDGALAELSAAGVGQEAITIMVVPGAFELPLAATALAKTRRFACIVALGCVIRGDTPHFDYVSSEAASGLQLAALETGVPVSFGVLTLDRVEQAEARVGKGAEAVRSALEMADLFAHLRAAAAAR